MSGALPDVEQSYATAPNKVPLTAERKARASARRKSNFELGAGYNNGICAKSSPAEFRRRPVVGLTTNSNPNHSNCIDTPDTNEKGNMLEDTTILDIAAGPYATAHQQPAIAHGANKENTPSPCQAEPTALPALSSSEWLFDTHKVLRVCQSMQPVTQPTAVHPAFRAKETRAMSRYSPARLQVSPGGGAGREGKVGTKEGGKDGSPGQRLAGEWLEKRNRDGTPAFL